MEAERIKVEFVVEELKKLVFFCRKFLDWLIIISHVVWDQRERAKFASSSIWRNSTTFVALSWNVQFKRKAKRNASRHQKFNDWSHHKLYRWEFRLMKKLLQLQNLLKIKGDSSSFFLVKLIIFWKYLQRKRHRVALKKRRCLARKEQAAEYAKLLAQRQKEAKARRQEELKRRRSASMRDSKSSSQSAPPAKKWTISLVKFK